MKDVFLFNPMEKLNETTGTLLQMDLKSENLLKRTKKKRTLNIFLGIKPI